MPGSRIPVACYGKLPFWSEYLEVGVGLPTSRALRGWLHAGREEAGMSTLEGEPPADIELRKSLRLLIGLPGSTELLAGVLRPSMGAGGRHFPFTTFAHFPRRTFGRNYELLPLALVPLWEQLGDAWDSLADVASKGAFDEVRTSLSIAPPEEPKQVRAAYQQMLAQPLDGLFDRDDGAGVDHLRQGMPRLLECLRRRDAAGARAQLPVSADLEQAGFDASVWIGLCNQHFFMRRFDPCVLLDETRGIRDRRVFLKFGALAPTDYPDAMELGGPSEALLRPAHPDSIGDAPAATGESGMTYGQLLKRRF